MTILVDAATHPAHGRWWAHLVSDTSPAELHAFAAALGLPRRAFEGDHYDVPADLVAVALAHGAVQVGTRDLLVALRAAGLRTPKRRGEKVLTSSGPLPERVDVVRSARVPTPYGRHVLIRCEATFPVWYEMLPEAVDPHGHGVVLGFRRTWGRVGGRRVVRHDGVVVAGEPDGLAGLGSPHWWAVLLT